MRKKSFEGRVALILDSLKLPKGSRKIEMPSFREAEELWNRVKLPKGSRKLKIDRRLIDELDIILETPKRE